MTPLFFPSIDPQLGLSRAARAKIHRAAWSRWFNDPMNVTNYTGVLIGLLFAYLFLPDLIEPIFGGHRWWMTLAWLAIYALSVLGLIIAFTRCALGPCVYRELRSRGHDVCLRCGYLLAGLPADQRTCPECGAVDLPRRANDPGDSPPVS